MNEQNVSEKAKSWRDMIQIDNDGRQYLGTEGAALFLCMAVKTLSNIGTRGPRSYRKGRKNRYYIVDLAAWDEARTTISNDTNWYMARKAG